MAARPLDTLAEEFTEEARRPAEPATGFCHGGNQHQEHHDVHDVSLIPIALTPAIL